MTLSRRTVAVGLAFSLMCLACLACLACSKRDDSTVTAPRDPVKPITQPNLAVVEAPMVLTPPEAGTIPAPPTVVKPPSDAFVTSSGLASKRLSVGTGTVHPGPHAKVTVHYSGWTTDGKMFDSSVMRLSTVNFPLDAVIPGWTEGVQLMVEGETRRLWIPEKLAYKGSTSTGAPKGMLVFDVQLIRIEL